MSTDASRTLDDPPVACTPSSSATRYWVSRATFASQPWSSGRNGTASASMVAFAYTASAGACSNRSCASSQSSSSATSIGNAVVIPCPISCRGTCTQTMPSAPILSQALNADSPWRGTSAAGRRMRSRSRQNSQPATAKPPADTPAAMSRRRRIRLFGAILFMELDMIAPDADNADQVWRRAGAVNVTQNAVLILIILIFAAAEIASGRHKKFKATADDGKLELFMFVSLLALIQPLIFAAMDKLGMTFFPQYRNALAGLPWWAMFGVLLIGDDLTQYWWHRVSHTPLLWPLHRAHHTAHYMSIRITYRNNFFYYMMMPGIWASGVLIFLGFANVYLVYVMR